MRVQLGKLRTLYKYLISYTIILLLPLLVFTYIINTSILSSFQEQILKVNTENLSRVMDQTNQIFSEMKRIALSISENPRLTPYIIKTNNYRASEGINELKSYKYANDYLYDILYYIRQDERIYGSYQSGNVQMMLSSIYRFDKWNYEQFYHDINTIELPYVRPAEKVSSGYTTMNNIMPYIYPINSYSPYATVVFFIDNQRMKKMMGSILEEYIENLYIFDQDGVTLTSLKGNDTLTDKQLEFIKDRFKTNDSGFFLLPGNQYFIIHMKSSNNNWTYVSISRNNLIMSKVSDIQQKVFIAILGIFIIGSLLIAVSTYMNYNPLYRLQKKIKDKLIIRETGKNEIENMNNAFDEIFTINDKLMTSLEKYKESFRNHLFQELISGNAASSNKEMMGIYNEIKLSLPEQAIYLVAIFSFSSADMNDRSRNLANTIHNDICKQTDNALIKAYPVGSYRKDQLVYIFFTDIDNKDSIVMSVNRVITNTCNSILKNMGVTAKIGIGGLYDDVLSISKSYIEAEQTLQYNLADKSEYIFVFRNTADNSSEKVTSSYPYDSLKRLSLQLRNCDGLKAQKTLGTLLDDITDKNIPRFFAQSIISDIFNMLLKTAIEMKIDLKLITGDIPDIFSLYEMRSMEDVSMILNSIFNNLFKYMPVQNSNEGLLFNRALAYIEGKYTSYEFSLENMSKHLAITVPYLSKVFKENVGVTISDYVWELRLEKAKTLLKSSNLPMKDIVESIGYIDISSFSRKFKEGAGMSPGAYRQKYADFKGE